MNKWGVGLTLLLASTSVLAKDIQLLKRLIFYFALVYPTQGTFVQPKRNFHALAPREC